MKLKLSIISLLIIVFAIGSDAFAQDVIVLKNGDEIKAAVSLINTEAVTYKKFENLTGPDYSIKKSEVFMIKYANGTKDVFKEQTDQKIETPAVISANVTGTFTDPRDGKTYKTVTIGSQTWMAENLAYKTKGCMAYDDADSNVAKYGYLYKYHDAMKACPAGWHLPSKYDLIALAATYGGGYLFDTENHCNNTDKTSKEYYTAFKLKATSGWMGDTTSTNESGFTALPGGLHMGPSGFKEIGIGGHWWTSTEDEEKDDVDFVRYSYTYNFYSQSGCVMINSIMGASIFSLSVRCVKDK
jgi:uncharacterized protein (TIGR02145 family)